MAPSNLFKGLTFLCIPKSRAQSYRFRTGLFAEAGAELASLLETRVTHVIVMDNVTPRLDTPESIGDYLFRQARTKKTRHLLYEMIDKKLANVVSMKWATQCMKSELLVSPETYELAVRLPQAETAQPQQNSVRKKPSVVEIPSSGSDSEVQISQTSERPEVSKTKRKRRSSSSESNRSSVTPPSSPSWADDILLSKKPKVSQDNPNSLVIDAFTSMMNYEQSRGEPWKAMAYRRAIATLRRQTKPIRTAEEARQIRGIGDSLAAKLEEVVQTNGLKALKMAQSDDRARIVETFEKIYAVGTATAQTWYREGYRTLEDVKKKPDLTSAQRYGLEFYEDWLQRIPRDEVEKHFRVIEEAMKELNPAVECHLMGSYRRGAPDCGDIDVIFMGEGFTMEDLQPLLTKLIEKLKDSGYIRCSLTTFFDESSKWSGGGMLKEVGICRRVDFLLVDWRTRGAAFIYFTGDDLFNRSLRYHASTKGYHLNNKGLYKIKDLTDMKNHLPGNLELVEAADERRIFEILDVPYKTPEERNS